MVFLVALPLCLGVALASDAPLFSGIVTGILGGILAGSLSGSHTSVSGPAAGLTAIVAAQIAGLGSFPAFLTAVFLAGVIQVGLGLARAGFISAFFPSSVIKGLLAAIGVILILKQIPHVLGHDPDPVGEMTFAQADGENTFSELLATMFDIQPGAALVGLASLALLLMWDRLKWLKATRIPPQLCIVLLGAAINGLWRSTDSSWAIGVGHLVNVPVTEGVDGALSLLVFPDWSQLLNPQIIPAAITIAVVASLETLLSLDAVDRLDPAQRHSPPNRELLAQGVGNMAAGLVGGLPMTSVIVRSSVNVSSGNTSRFSTIIHGALLFAAVMAIPAVLNTVPLASLAAILLATGLKLANPALFRQMWKSGRRQFSSFAVTVAAIVLLDLLTGVIIGLVLSTFFILYSNFRKPLNSTLESHSFGEVLRIELANQVSFLSRGALEVALNEVEDGGHVLIDARKTVYVDPDILDFIKDFRDERAVAHGIEVSFLGFGELHPELRDAIRFVEHSNVGLQQALNGREVLELLKEGNDRFRNGERLTRDVRRQVSATAPKPSPMTVALSCMDSRTSIELIFDQGIGDMLSVRVAGNVATPKVLGSLEYGCVVTGAKLLLVLGHSSCGSVATAVRLHESGRSALEETGGKYVEALINEIQISVRAHSDEMLPPAEEVQARKAYNDAVARTNVLRTMASVRSQSEVLDRLIAEGKVELVGGMYDVGTGQVQFFNGDDEPLERVVRTFHPKAGLAVDPGLVS